MTLADKVRKQSLGILAWVKSLTFKSAQEAIDLAKQIKAHRALFDKEFAFATDLRRMANSISKTWNPAVGPLDESYRYLMAEHDRILAEARAAQQKALEEAAALSKVDPEAARTEIARAVEATAPKVEGAHQRAYWSAEVVDESKLPRWCWVIDYAALDREAREKKEAFDVPGAKAVRELRGVVR